VVEEQKTVRLALFGESDVGKSHYGGQLLLRLNTEQCELRMHGAASNITAFNEVTQRLNEGVPAPHTAATVYYESVWPVVDNSGGTMDLSWPDYAGEQVKAMLDERKISSEWHDRIRTADSWLLMVRPSLIKKDDDILSRPLTDVAGPTTAREPGRRSSQTRLVELLQMLLFAQRTTAGGARPPVLAVLLSCWDELENTDNRTPWQVLLEHLPLLAAFVENNWESSRAVAYGISALGVELRAEQPNKAFVNQGPEHFGFVVMPDGQRNTDLTIPIAQVAKIARS